MYRKIEDQFSNDGAIKDSNHAKAAITQLVNFVGNKIELIYASLGHSEVGTKRAAQLRGFYQMYNLGLNFIQSCVVNGGVIIYGPNIEADPETQRLLGLKGKYLFEKDRFDQNIYAPTGIIVCPPSLSITHILISVVGPIPFGVPLLSIYSKSPDQTEP